MATLNTQTFTDLVRGQVAAIQGAAAGIVDFTIGSIMRAVVEAFAQVVLWLQAMAITILGTTRASTSQGPDLDTWMADYKFERDEAFAAYGLVTFSRFTPTQAALIAIGASVETADGSEQYLVTLDPTNSLYSAALGGYSLPAGQASASVPVTCTTPGAAGNAAQGAINTITQAMPGVDIVTNPVAFENGADAESDPAFRCGSSATSAASPRATQEAIEFALAQLGADVDYTAVENQTYAGVAQPGFFYVVVDDGTGNPSSESSPTHGPPSKRFAASQSALRSTAAAVLQANVGITVVVAAGYSASAVQTAVENAVSTFVDGLSLGVALPWSRLNQLAYDASRGVANVTSVTLNGFGADLNPSNKQVVKLGTLTVSAA